MDKLNKNQQLVQTFQTHLENNDTDAIQKELPKLLKSFLKLDSRMDRILKQSDNQQFEVLKLKERVEQSNTRISTLLNNAGQGFLYFDQDMIIGDEYSKEVTRIFKTEVASQEITKLLYPDNVESEEFLKATLQSILKDEPMRQEILISLLQKEFEINDCYIELEYKVLNETSFMLILTDVTAQKELAKKIKKEQQILKMVVETVTTLEQFLEVKSDYEEFIEQIESFDDLEHLQSLRNSVHTFKGLFAQKEMYNVVEKLHEFESYIDVSIKKDEVVPEVANMTKQNMHEWLQKDIDILRSILEDKFLEKKHQVSIDVNRIRHILDIVEKFADKDEKFKNIYHDIEKLTYHHVKIFLDPYKKLVEQLASKLEKYVEPLVLEYDDVYISDRYKAFFNSLVHIFRNSVDHGIETLEERYELEKSEYGLVKCRLKQENEKLIISISDDGRGIDIEKIKNKALEKGLHSQQELEIMSEKEIIMLIFNEGFSTTSVVTNISGRGVGLASTLEELNKLDGTLDIQNTPNVGLKFTFTIPYKG